MLEMSYIDLIFMIRHDDIGEAVAVLSQTQQVKDKNSGIRDYVSYYSLENHKQAVTDTILFSRLMECIVITPRASHQQAPSLLTRKISMSRSTCPEHDDLVSAIARVPWSFRQPRYHGT